MQMHRLQVTTCPVCGNTLQRRCCEITNKCGKHQQRRNKLQLHRISLGVYDFNTSAIKCYKASGFALEGVTRDVLWMDETFWSLVEMSMLEDEWRAL